VKIRGLERRSSTFAFKLYSLAFGSVSHAHFLGNQLTITIEHFSFLCIPVRSSSHANTLATGDRTLIPWREFCGLAFSWKIHNFCHPKLTTVSLVKLTSNCFLRVLRDIQDLSLQEGVVAALWDYFLSPDVKLSQWNHFRFMRIVERCPRILRIQSCDLRHSFAGLSFGVRGLKIGIGH